MTDFKKENPTGVITSITHKDGKLSINGKLFQVSEKQLPYLDRYHADDNVEYSANKEGVITFLRKLSTEFKTANQVNSPKASETFEELVAKNFADMDKVVDQAESFFSTWEHKLETKFTSEDKRAFIITNYLQSKR